MTSSTPTDAPATPAGKESADGDDSSAVGVETLQTGHRSKNKKARLFCLKWLDTANAMLRFVSDFIQVILSRGFYQLGKMVAKFPFCTIVLVLLLTTVCGVGLINFTPENRAEKLWIPQNTQAFTDNEYSETNYGKGYRFNNVIITNGAAATSDTLTKTFLATVFALHNELIAISVTVDGTVYTYNGNLCYKPDSTHCNTISVLDAWDFSSTTLAAEASDSTAKATVDSQTTTWTGATWNIDRIAQGRSGSGSSLAATVLKMQYQLVRNEKVEAGKTVDPPALAWEAEFIRIAQSYNGVGGLVTYVQAERSRSDEFGAAITGDIALVGVGYVLIIVYTVTMLGRCDCRNFKGLVSVAAVASVGFAILSAYGFCSAVGLFYGPVQSVLPFLLLGIGVDDAFVIMVEYAQVDPALPVPERIGRTMQHAGVSITLTSVTDFVAFAISAYTELPALRAFCLFAAVGIIFDFLYQITFFVAVLSLDARRQKAGRAEMCPCVPALCLGWAVPNSLRRRLWEENGVALISKIAAERNEALRKKRFVIPDDPAPQTSDGGYNNNNNNNNNNNTNNNGAAAEDDAAELGSPRGSPVPRGKRLDDVTEASSTDDVETGVPVPEWRDARPAWHRDYRLKPMGCLVCFLPWMWPELSHEESDSLHIEFERQRVRALVDAEGPEHHGGAAAPRAMVEGEDRSEDRLSQAKQASKEHLRLGGFVWSWASFGRVFLDWWFVRALHLPGVGDVPPSIERRRATADVHARARRVVRRNCLTRCGAGALRLAWFYRPFSGKLFHRVVYHIMGPLIQNRFIKPLLILLGVVVFGVSVWGATTLTQEFTEESFIPDGSYLLDYNAISEKYFTFGVPFSTIFKTHDVYADRTTLDTVYTNVKAVSWAQAATCAFWYDSYKTYLTNNGLSTSTIGEAAFYSNLQTFLAANTRYAADVVYASGSTTSITTHRFGCLYKALDGSKEYVAAMDDARAAAGSTALDAFAFSFAYLNWESFKIIERELIQNLVSAIVAVFCITLLLNAHPFVALLVTLSVVQAIINMMGFAALWGLKIDSVFVINAVIAIGLAVDYSAHIGHAFMVAQGTRAERALESVRTMGEGVLNGAISTFLAVLMLAFSKSFVFRVFFVQLFLIVLFGVFHGILMIPAVLSYIGPAALPVRDVSKKESAKALELMQRRQNNEAVVSEVTLEIDPSGRQGPAGLSGAGAAPGVTKMARQTSTSGPNAKVRVVSVNNE